MRRTVQADLGATLARLSDAASEAYRQARALVYDRLDYAPADHSALTSEQRRALSDLAEAEAMVRECRRGHYPAAAVLVIPRPRPKATS
jgi:hypothetical protein